jgi:hypothetical protein
MIIPSKTVSLTMSIQTTTPYRLLLRPDKKALCETYIGKPLDILRTPAFIVDRAIFAENCAKMLRASEEWGAKFRCHLKTHKVINFDNYPCDTYSSTDDRGHKTTARTWRLPYRRGCRLNYAGSLGSGTGRSCARRDSQRCSSVNNNMLTVSLIGSCRSFMGCL